MKKIIIILVALCLMGLAGIAQNKVDEQKTGKADTVKIKADTLDHRKIYATAIVDSLTPEAFEKSAERNGLCWGIKAGVNFSNLHGGELGRYFADSKTSFKPGFTAGAFVKTRAGKHISLHHELLYSFKRVGVNMSDTTNGAYASKLGTHYIDLYPANVALQAGGLSLYAGPYVSALLAANIQRKDENGRLFNDRGIFGDDANDESENKYFQKFDFGLNAGLEYQIKHFTIGARYTHGLIDIIQYANSYANEEEDHGKIKIYNKGFLISVGYVF